MADYSSEMSKVSLVIPVYNEEINIPILYEKLKTLFANDLKENYEIIFVNDGSQDNSENILKNIAKEDKKVKVINFSRNFGHQAALTAGMHKATGDCCISMDCDLQHPPHLIIEMIKRWEDGFEIVYARRKKRKDNFFKRVTATLYYFLLEKVGEIKIPRNVGDFRLIDRKVLDILNKCPERSRYLRGLVSWVGFKSTFIDFEMPNRQYGETGYSLKKMLKLAFDGLTSFSLIPLRISMLIGFLAVVIALTMLITMLTLTIFSLRSFPIWVYLIVVLFMFGGMNFICIWLLGEYIGRIYIEQRHRPLYIIKEEVNFDKDE